MKLLFIGNVGYRFNSFVMSSSMAAKELGIEFHVAGSWTGYDDPQDKIADEEKYGVKIHQVDFKRTPYHPQNIRAYRQIVNLIRKEDFDIIHCNTPIGGVIGRLAGKKCNVKRVIYQAHGFHFYNGAPGFNWLLYYPIERLLAHLTDTIITINQEDYNRAQKFKLRNNGNVYYVPGVGIDLRHDYPRNSKKSIRGKKREEIGLDDETICAISVGDLNKNKNNQVIIEALMNVPGVNYLICGNGPLSEQLKKIANPIKERVHFLGYRTDIQDLMLASDIFIIPSLREGLSRSLMEAMSAGMPCIVSNIRGNTDLIDSNGGIICNPTRKDDFSVALKKLSRDSILRAQMGNYNKNKIVNFSLDTVKCKLKTIYSGLI